MKRALTIAGSDSSGGAGIQADLRTFAAHGVYGASAVTAITAQNSLGITAVQVLPADLVVAQIEAVANEAPVDVVKTGMLASAVIVEAVVAAILALALPRVVVDPVIVASTGKRLLEEEAIAMLKTELLPLALVVTPNRTEAETLSGQQIASLADARDAAKRIHALGPAAVVVTGGHLDGNAMVDVFYDGRQCLEFNGPRIHTTNTHGSGCTYAAAFAANLALGLTLADAAERSKRFAEAALRHGLPLGRGGTVYQIWND